MGRRFSQKNRINQDAREKGQVRSPWVGQQEGRTSRSTIKSFTDRFLTVFTYVCIGTIPVWLVLKICGAIHSPEWVDWIPFVAFALAIAIPMTKIAYKTGKTDEKMTQLHTDVQDLKQTTSDLYRGFVKLEENVKLRERDLERINGKVKEIENNPKKE